MQVPGSPRSLAGLVIFDCDGVLVDSERLVVEIEAQTLTEMGWPIAFDEVVRRFVGGSRADMMKRTPIWPDAGSVNDPDLVDDRSHHLERPRGLASVLRPVPARQPIVVVRAQLDVSARESVIAARSFLRGAGRGEVG